MSDASEAMGPLYAAPAAIRAAPADTALLADALLARARKRAPDPAIFDERPPFFWSAEISSTRLDAYFTRMSAKTSLPNYAEDAERGVSFQNSHDWRQLGFGQSLAGRFVGPGGNGIARTEADFYTIPGLRLNNVSTDDFIGGVRAGIIKDVSIGFSGGQFICSICSRDMLSDWSCPHIPGFRYDPDMPDDWMPLAYDDPAGVVATATVENARLAEVSAVYDGATPGAAIQKAIQAAEQGRLSEPQQRLLEQRYRIKLPLPPMLVRGATVEVREEDPMAGKTDTPPERRGMGMMGDMEDGTVGGEVADTMTETCNEILQLMQDAGVDLSAERGSAVQRLRAGVRTLLAERGRTLPLVSEVATLRPLADEVTRLRAQAEAAASLPDLRAEVERLRPLAQEVLDLRPLRDEVARLTPLAAELETSRGTIADGVLYRADLIADAIAQGARALGNDFNEALYRRVLEAPSLDLAVIKQMRADWKTQGDARYPATPQTSQGETPPETTSAPTPPNGSRPAAPDAAYAA